LPCCNQCIGAVEAELDKLAAVKERHAEFGKARCWLPRERRGQPHSDAATAPATLMLQRGLYRKVAVH